MNRIAIFTSGGDAPGMNAHIRAVVRSCLNRGIEPIGIYEGYQGMIDGDIATLGRKETANIISRGGTILKTARCEDFKTEQGRERAAKNVRDHGIEGIIACGGDGTFHGAHYLYQEHGIPIVGTPGTIDNDLFGTDYTIGYDTAINTAAEAIDRIRDTAESHGRVFVVEVMGRHAGFIAMDVGVACGAKAIAVPETHTDLADLAGRINEHAHRRTIIIVGEGDQLGSATDVSRMLKESYDIDSKVAILGHIQRGGTPTVRDRVLASRLGVSAVNMLLAGKSDCMIGEHAGEITTTPLNETWEKKKPLPTFYVELSSVLV
ncbi:MAG: 6-phosphofructokinase [Candidatus Kapabacteria bacterium]|nr:6-phosphofructokinase [Candidatus Kapabacteria bacterium]